MAASLSAQRQSQFKLERALAKCFYLVGDSLQSNDESLAKNLASLHQALEQLIELERFQFLRFCFELEEHEIKLIGLAFIQAIEPDCLTPYLGLTWYEHGPYLSLDKLLVLSHKHAYLKSKVSAELNYGNALKWGLLQSKASLALTEGLYLAPEALCFLQAGQPSLGEASIFSPLKKRDVGKAFPLLNKPLTDMAEQIVKHQLNSVLHRDAEFVHWYVEQLAYNQNASFTTLSADVQEGITPRQMQHGLTKLFLSAFEKKVVVLMPHWAKCLFDASAEIAPVLDSQSNIVCCFFGDPYTSSESFKVRTLLYPDESTLANIWLALSPATLPTPQDKQHAYRLATRYPIPLSRMQSLAEHAVLHNDGEDYWQSLAKLCLLEQKKGPQELATLIEPRYCLDDMILAESTLQQLQELVARCNFQSEMKHRLPRFTEGCKALFWGRPGTGKTMAAEAIAGELQLPVYVVNLANIASKWIGETEKHLAKLFDEAQRSNAVLLFDEADAVFAKRSQVESSHDKNANMGVSYLLQRMERYTGLLLLSTNLKANLDDAFIRRFHSVVEFTLPNYLQRLAIWQRVLGNNASEELLTDLDGLAKRFELSAAQIINITETALLKSLMLKRPMIGKENIAKALRTELSKQHEGFMAQHEIRDWLEGN
ncbi:ATP-binding protein [Pseudoalteromonas sp. SMS1]|uniref:ATP-binding protein n=1 Tax=Pseudoalteromonas sp. SMS1 TaxID=2908894 RepID=UPI001F2F5F54|nr:ATP-binding protein [Pseudoalteromonas sp. SMS1]MCF2858039.1 ATP-binding protein [Pseudoalteromonas sp. SMS1]